MSARKWSTGGSHCTYNFVKCIRDSQVIVQHLSHLVVDGTFPTFPPWDGDEVYDVAFFHLLLRSPVHIGTMESVETQSNIKHVYVYNILVCACVSCVGLHARMCVHLCICTYVQHNNIHPYVCMYVHGNMHAYVCTDIIASVYVGTCDTCQVCALTYVRLQQLTQ